MQHRKQLVAFAKSQIDYCLGSSGRSFVVGFGTNPPVRAHHRAASCKTTPDSKGRRVACGWEAYWSTAPNPQVRSTAMHASAVPCLAGLQHAVPHHTCQLEPLLLPTLPSLPASAMVL